MARYTIFAIILASVLVWWKPATVQADTLHCFDQSGFCVSNPVVWDYFTHRGGVNTFGYPISQQFLFEGSQVQFFQRRVIQIEPNGQAGLLNVLDPDIMPYTQFNGAAFPAVNPQLTNTAPPATNEPAALAFVQSYVPNTWEGSPVNFDQTFLGTVTCADAYPNGNCQTQLLPGMDLEMWGLPTSRPMVDPNNHNFVYQRFQRGVMMYDASSGTTQSVLFGQYLKELLTGRELPNDLSQEAAGGPMWLEYWPGAPNAVRDPDLLRMTYMDNAFTPDDTQAQNGVQAQVAGLNGCEINILDWLVSMQTRENYPWVDFQSGAIQAFGSASGSYPGGCLYTPASLDTWSGTPGGAPIMTAVQYLTQTGLVYESAAGYVQIRSDVMSYLYPSG